MLRQCRKPVAPTSAVHAPRAPLLWLIMAGTLVACGEAEYRLVSSQPECEVTEGTGDGDGELRQYAIYEYLLPTKHDDLLPGTMDTLGEDMDGDGKVDNQFGDFFSYGSLRGGQLALPAVSLSGLINGFGVGKGRGTLLLDSLASRFHLGCARLTLRRAAFDSVSGLIQPDGSSRLRDEIGGQPTVLRASGTQAEISTISYRLLTAGDARTLDLYLPLSQTTHLLRLYGTRLTLQQDSAGTLTGIIRGVLRTQDVEESLAPVWARELTASVRPHLGEPDLGMRLAALENTEYGRKKCAPPGTECCHTMQPGCTIYPKELIQYYANSYAPDLDAFDKNGAWKLTPHTSGDPTDLLDSISVALGFHAVRVRHESRCQPGRFCELSGPGKLNSGERITAGWATRSSDLWVLTSAGRAFHYDGISWMESTEDLNVDGAAFVASSMWGAHSDDIWAGMSQSSSIPRPGLRHWDGGHWRQVPLDGQLPADATVYAIYGAAADDVWAAVAYPGGANSGSALVKFDGHKWAVKYGSIPKTVTALYAPRRGALWAAGYDYQWLRLLDDVNVEPASARRIGAHVMALAGTGEDNVWALTGGAQSPQGSCGHFDGQTWTVRPVQGCESQGRGYLTAWMDAAGVLWAAGEKGLLRRYDPKRDPGFVEIPHDSDQADIKVLFGVPEEAAVWAVTDGGELLRYQP